MLARFWAWWGTAHSSVVTHRRLKWLWISLIPVSYFLRESVAWVVFISHYAPVVGEWSAEEAAQAADREQPSGEEPS